jgi:hypothetical protein
MKFMLVIAAVLAGDPATTDPSLEAVPMVFESLAGCEAEKPGRPARPRARSTARR